VIFKKKTCTFESGVTVLVGCNGSGKSTLLQQIEYSLRKEKIPYTFHDANKDDVRMKRDEALFYSDIDFLSISMCSSEGENISNVLYGVIKEMGRLTKQNPDAKELWFSFDALDSGLSIDVIAEIKADLFQFVIEQNPDKDVYIIVSANGYEFANGERCYDVANCKEVAFKDYNDYRKFILKSRQQKIKRNEKWFGE
jgi:ATPase subunit of ABC transporter with duplicated ATPase domains